MRNLFKCTVVQSKPVVSVISVWFYGSVYMCFKWLYKKCLMKSRLRRFVDGTWYEDRTNGHALAKVYPSSRTLFHVAMYRIHVYPRALFRHAGTSRPCMTYKSNPFSVIQAGRALTVRLWSDWGCKNDNQQSFKGNIPPPPPKFTVFMPMLIIKLIRVTIRRRCTFPLRAFINYSYWAITLT